MCLFKRRPKVVEHNSEDAQLVEFFAKRIDVLLEYAETEPVKEGLKELRFLLEHLAVSPKDRVQKIDRQISNSIDDLKIHLAKKRDEASLLSEIRDIRVLVKERETAYFKEQ